MRRCLQLARNGTRAVAPNPLVGAVLTRGERILAELERLAAAPDGAAGLALAVETRLLEGWRGGKAPQETASPPGNGGPLASLGRLSPEQAAAQVLAWLEREDFGERVIADVRQP